MNKMLNLLWITCGMILPVLGIKSTISTCDVRIGNCDYQLQLLPSNQCHGDTIIRSRSKRSDQIGEVMEEFSSLQAQFDKLEKKLVKEMKHLSTRVLRGARRLESMADSGRSTEDGKKRGRCQQGFVTYDNWNSCYMFSTFNTTWYDARDYCVAMGGDLVSLGSLQEHFLVAFQILNDPEYSAAQGWWTSGTFMVKTKQWMWMSNNDIQPLTYVKWAVNEPNDQHDKNLQCLMMYRLDDMLWHDQICTDRYNFVCEISVA